MLRLSQLVLHGELLRLPQCADVLWGVRSAQGALEPAMWAPATDLRFFGGVVRILLEGKGELEHHATSSDVLQTVETWARLCTHNKVRQILWSS